MSLLLIIAVTFFAGMGAGLGTGFAGMSAAQPYAYHIFRNGSLRGCRYCPFF